MLKLKTIIIKFTKYCSSLIQEFLIWLVIKIFGENFVVRARVIHMLLKNRPKMHKYILPALIYPSIWGLYFSLSRYLRMGEIYDINFIFSYFTLEFVFIIILALPNLFVWLRVFIGFCNEIREVLWSFTIDYLHYIHLLFLQFNLYFYICEKLYKFYFLLSDVFIHGTGAMFRSRREEASFPLRLTSYIFYHFWIVNVLFFLVIFCESFIYNGQLYYSIYLLFIYPFILGILRCFREFGSSGFINNVCMSDYIYHRYIYATPRYTHVFLTKLNNPEFHYGFKEEFPEDLGYKTLIDAAYQALLYKRSLYNRRDFLKYRVHGIRVRRNEVSSLEFIPMGQARKYVIRLAGTYYSRNHIRWFSTTRAVFGPGREKLHSLVPHLIKSNPYQIIAYINHPLTNLGNIQKLTKDLRMPSSNTLYKYFEGNVILDEKRNLITTLENNFILRFQSLAEKGLI